MADIDKVVAAILTAGRVPTLWDKQPRPREDWLVEYNAWLAILEKVDGAHWTDDTVDVLHQEVKA